MSRKLVQFRNSAIPWGNRDGAITIVGEVSEDTAEAISKMSQHILAPTCHREILGQVLDGKLGSMVIFDTKK